MKKLTYAEKRILKTNQKSFKKHQGYKYFCFLGHYLRKLNSLAKKYNIDLYAVPLEEKDTYSFQSYKPEFKTFTDLYVNKLESVRASYPDKSIALFTLLPYFKTGKINRKNFYKEDKPAAYCDLLIYTKRSSNEHID